METTVYEDRARELISEIKKIIEVKGLNLADALEDAAMSERSAEKILNEGGIPTLSEFLALCEISGITFHLPSIETPKTAM